MQKFIRGKPDLFSSVFSVQSTPSDLLQGFVFVTVCGSSSGRQRGQQVVTRRDDVVELGPVQGLPLVVLPDELLRGADEDLDVAPDGGRDGLEGHLVDREL